MNEKNTKESQKTNNYLLEKMCQAILFILVLLVGPFILFLILLGAAELFQWLMLEEKNNKTLWSIVFSLGIYAMCLYIFLFMIRSAQLYINDYTLSEICKKAKNCFFPLGRGIKTIIDFPNKIFAFLRGLIFHPIAYLFVGSLLLVIFNDPNEEKCILFEIVLDKFLKEFGIFLIIASLASFVLESKNFIKKASDLIFTQSDYLKNMSTIKKKRFFSEILKNTYEFSDYGIESSFSEIALETFLPVFEKSYMKNYKIERVHEDITDDSEMLKRALCNVGYEQSEKDLISDMACPWKDHEHENEKDHELMKEVDFFMHEKRVWVTHFSKDAEQKDECKQKNVMYLNPRHMMQRLLYFSSEICMRKLEADDSECKDETKKDFLLTNSLGKIEFYLNPIHKNKSKDIAEEIDYIVKNRKAILNINNSEYEYKTRNFEDNIKHLLLQKFQDSIFLCKYYEPDGKKVYKISPTIETNFYEGIIKLSFKLKKDGKEVLVLLINTEQCEISFTFHYQQPSVKRNQKYKFQLETEGFEMYEEGAAFGMHDDHVLKNLTVNFIFSEGKKVIGEFGSFSATGNSPPNKANPSNILKYEHTGWLLKGHGFSVWYKVME
jgi:hypothetical protein